MDRLPTVIAAAALALACNDGGSSSSGTRERVNAVKAKAVEVDPAEMCDRYYAAGAGPKLAWPELVRPAAEVGAGAWRWINLWATWCKPCVEELTRITGWHDRLSRSGAKVELTLVSADESDDVVDAFREAHAGTPAGTRLADSEAATAWIASLGVKGATLPVHVFVDPAGHVRCVRASAIEDTDYAAVQALLRQ